MQVQCRCSNDLLATRESARGAFSSSDEKQGRESVPLRSTRRKRRASQRAERFHLQMKNKVVRAFLYAQLAVSEARSASLTMIIRIGSFLRFMYKIQYFNQRKKYFLTDCQEQIELSAFVTHELSAFLFQHNGTFLEQEESGGRALPQTMRSYPHPLSRRSICLTLLAGSIRMPQRTGPGSMFSPLRSCPWIPEAE
jgi:hypothetical protein